MVVDKTVFSEKILKRLLVKLEKESAKDSQHLMAILSQLVSENKTTHTASAGR